jgi:hypothetical protein
MHAHFSSVLVDDHRRRLREAAQAPLLPRVSRLWARLRRREEPARPVELPTRELERLAA